MEFLLKHMLCGQVIIFIVVLGIGGSFQNGFHITVINSPSPFIQNFINESWMSRYGKPMERESVKLIWSVLVSMYSIGGLIGSISIRCFVVKFGRKKSMIYNSILSIVTAAIMGSSRKANSFEMILVARFLYGFSAGLGLNIHLMYLGESSPKQLRGLTTMTAATFTSLGKLFGQLVGLSELLGQEDLWHILLCCASFISILQLVALPFLPEAPRYLLIDKGNEEMCRKALQRLWGKRDFKVEIEEMLAEQAAINGEKPKSLSELLKDRESRWQLLTMLVVLIAIQFCGISAICAYSFNVFYEAGISEDNIRYVTLGIGVSEVLTTITCAFLIENTGRRALLWKGFICMSLIMTLITVTLYLRETISWIPYSTVCLIFLFVICFGGGPASVLPSLSHEIFIQSSRPAAFVFTGILRWVGFSVLVVAFPFLIDSLKHFSFLFFGSVCLGAGVYVFLFVPETKGKTVLEISEDFKKINVHRHWCTKNGNEDNEWIIATRL
ncbi:solute carrier family 2 member 9, like 1 [Lepisosteus oculatus]|nr:PREDICTED: solute carrier family 2, facilitated glucose transporter member 11-like isoform X1 [Lepisosteus oculatus]